MPGKPEDVAPLLERIVEVAPDLKGAPYEVLGEGWDSVALDVAGEWIFKFPRSKDAEERLLQEAAFLDVIVPCVRMNVPRLTVHDRAGAPFSQHRKIAGEHLLTDGYLHLDDARRDRLARQLAELLVDLHAIPVTLVVEVGAGPVETYPDPEWLLARIGELPAHLHAYVHRTVERWRGELARSPDLVFGQFDGHGWNMAFDHEAGALNGVYDFADSGIGERHCDLSISNWIDPDLTGRIVTHYMAMTGIAIDRQRIDLYTAVLRLKEHLSEEEIEWSLNSLEDWAEYEQGLGR